MLIPSYRMKYGFVRSSLSRRVNANSQPNGHALYLTAKLIKKGEC